MTEEEWDRCDDWRPMLAALGDGIGERKGLLYLCAGMRQIWHLLYDEASHAAVEVAERMADGRATEEEIDKADWDSEVPTFGYDFKAEFIREHMPDGNYSPAVRKLMEMGVFAEADIHSGERPRVESFEDRLRHRERLGDERIVERLINAANIPYHCICRIMGKAPLHPHMLEHLSSEPEWPGGWLVREIFGNPFRPPRFDPAWRTPDVVGLARTIYDEKAFDRLPILSDALLDAGCNEDRIVAHCREAGPHARGCWVVDRVLGLE
jgi:hypothetical protein